nr:zinc finger and SCAN domain-containing protein 12-like [Aedes albopictus]
MESTPCLNAEQALLQCRLCLADDLDELISLHCRCASHQDKLLVEMITEVTRLDTFDREADTLPQHICSQCLTRLDAAYSFLRIAKDASAALDRCEDRCQICQRDAVDELISMFCVSASDGQLIVDMLRDVCGVPCREEDDDQPQYVCRECFELLSAVYSFRNMVLESDTSWRQTLELENDLTNDTVEIGDPIKIEPMEVHDEDILITSTREARNAYLQKQAKIKDEEQDDEAENACAEASSSSPKLPVKYDKNGDPFIYLDSAEVDIDRLKPLLFTQENAEYYDQLLFKGTICCCRKLLRDHAEWQKHCKETHSDSAEEKVTTSSVIECKSCHRKFNSASQYKEHIQSRQKNIFYRCKICNIMTRERSALADHFEFTRFHPIFHNSETVRSYFEERVETSYESSGDCCGCGEQFESGKALLKHTKAVHYPLGNDRPTFQCLVCYTSFANKQSLYKHQLAYSTTKTYRCRKAKCAFQSIGLSAEIKKHIESDKHHFKPTEFFCCFYGCYETFGSNQALEQHCVEDHAEQRINNGRFSANATSNVCWLCNRQLATDKAYREHLRGQYDRKYVCSTCGRKFISHAGVVQHEKDIHLIAETRSFPCDRCSTTFSKQIYLTKHIRTVHDNIRTESCSFCEKRFVNKRALKEHIKNKHMEEKPYKCTECSMTFGNRFNLRRHLTTHSTERPHTCSHCGNTYRYQSDMKRHIDAIHLGNKPFACEVCEARFIRTRDLQVHMMRHTKTKLYKCTAPDCDYSTNFRKTLDEHLLEHYDGMKCF